MIYDLVIIQSIVNLHGIGKRLGQVFIGSSEFGGYGNNFD